MSRSLRASGVAELLWDAPGAPPQALGAVPLLLGEQPALALTWAHAAQAREVAARGTATLVLSEPRLSGPGWSPLALSGAVTLVEDADGSLFQAQLLTQELRKHPPSRALADSTMLRREHWWYLPRLVLLLEPSEVVAVRPREGPLDAVLAVAPPAGGDLSVSTVTVRDWAAPQLELAGGPAGAHGPAALVGQELSVPDLERWTVHRTQGDYLDGRLTGVTPAATRALEPVPGLLARLRRHRALERSCLRALRAEGLG
jgi:hypothetical protein